MLFFGSRVNIRSIKLRVTYTVRNTSFCTINSEKGSYDSRTNSEKVSNDPTPTVIPTVVMADDVAGDNEECLLCEMLNENPLKLAPSKDDIDQLLLHHVLVKLERGQRQLEQQQAVFDKINSLVEVVVSKTSQFDQLDIRLKSLELSLMGQQHKLQMIDVIKADLQTIEKEVKKTNSSIFEEVAAQQANLDSRLTQLDAYVGWEYSRTTKMSGGHGVIVFDKNLVDATDGAYEPNTGIFTAKVPGMYYISVIFGVTKKIWYVHLRKNNIYIASVQKDYNQGYEDSVNLHALVELQVGDVIDVFCSNTDIDFRSDYNAAKFTGFLVGQQ